ncbi:hypothetical protein HanRHA438_Chr03g0105751 [Helianthus annuus]|nr:hypothetical protein HanOQP8_Chr03g0091891 [Helianthus annuus]KAJ0934291.1 hypothetical protein HanRHA438_Chr03g0105751 [Helianthus annuus]KAJ0942367.1 hypothetical protein HanPSC8_Chr03g0091131 [Helianthus annuus]
MNTITCLILNRPYNVSQVIFEYLKENIRAGSDKYIMYPRFIMMMIDDQFMDIPKDNSDILGLRNMTSETIIRLTKGSDERVNGKICRIKDPDYVAPENDRWRHEKSDSDNEDQRMIELVEKKTRWWFVRDGKRKRTPKTSPAVPILKKPVPKIVVKGIVKGGVNACFAGPSVEPQQKLVDETVIDPSSIPQESIDLAKVTLEQFIQLNEATSATQKDQSSSVQAEVFKATEPEDVVQDDSSEDDSEATESESERDPTTLGRGKAQLKKKPTKKQKGSDKEDSTYVPPEKTKKLRKRKSVPTGVIPRRVREKKTGAELPKDKDGKKEKHVEKSKVTEAEKIQSVEIPEVKSVEVPDVKVQKKSDGDDYVEIMGYKAATPPPPPPQDQPESSQRRDTTFDNLFGELPHATGVYRDDILEEDYDMFNNEAVKELSKKVVELEKEKAKAEAERDALKRQIEELMKAHDEIRMVIIDQEEKLKKMEDDVEDSTKLSNVMQEEISEMNKKLAKMNDINQTLNQLISELHEASANEMKAMKLEMEAMKTDKLMKDNQLNMLYAVMESHLKIDVDAAFNEIEVKRAEDRRVERERELVQEATERRKGLVVDTEEILGSSSQPEAGGSSSQVDVEMVEAEADPQGFMLVGESSESLDLNDILYRVHVLQKKKKTREMLMLKWKDEAEVEEETQNFVLIGKPSSVPYSIKEIVRQIKVKERRRKFKIARGEIVDDDSDKELFGDEEGDEDDNDDDDKSDQEDDKDDKNDDDYQGASGILIENPNVQQRIEEFLNDEINE